jgi:hypothetical protein
MFLIVAMIPLLLAAREALMGACRCSAPSKGAKLGMSPGL